MLDPMSHSQGRAQLHNEWWWGACSSEKGMGQEGRGKPWFPSFYLVSAWGPVYLDWQS